MDPEVISTIAYTIRNSKLPNKKKVFEKEYKEFADKYPTLFDMCCSQGAGDMHHLDMMLKMLKQINNKQVTNHVASVHVGQKLYDAFVNVKEESAGADEGDADEGVEIVAADNGK
jgi:hypothetical protein